MKSKSHLFHLSKISMGTHSLVTMALVAEEEEGMVLRHLWLWHTCVLTLGALQSQHPQGALVSAHKHNSLSRVHNWNGLDWHGLKLPKALDYGLDTHTGMVVSAGYAHVSTVSHI